MKNDQDIICRLRKRAEIRRSIPTRKSVQAKEPDRIADLLEEAAAEIEKLRAGRGTSQSLPLGGGEDYTSEDK